MTNTPDREAQIAYVLKGVLLREGALTVEDIDRVAGLVLGERSVTDADRAWAAALPVAEGGRGPVTGSSDAALPLSPSLANEVCERSPGGARYRSMALAPRDGTDILLRPADEEGWPEEWLSGGWARGHWSEDGPGWWVSNDATNGEAYDGAMEDREFLGWWDLPDDGSQTSLASDGEATKAQPGATEQKPGIETEVVESQALATSNASQGEGDMHSQSPTAPLLTDPMPNTWRPMTGVPKYAAPVLLKLKGELPRDDLKNWEGRAFVGTYHGKHTEWCFAAPVGHGGFPDEWFEGWAPLPAEPSPAGEKLEGGE